MKHQQNKSPKPRFKVYCNMAKYAASYFHPNHEQCTNCPPIMELANSKALQLAEDFLARNFTTTVYLNSSTNRSKKNINCKTTQDQLDNLLLLIKTCKVSIMSIRFNYEHENFDKNVINNFAYLCREMKSRFS